MTEFVKTKDGQNIAYSCSGNGVGLVMLHGGFVQDRSIWDEFSYVASLKDNFKIVAIDIRGHGESSKPIDAKFYSIETLVNDIEEVVEASGLKEYYIWGFSLGASISLHVSTMKRVKGIIASGSFFGKDLIDHAKQNIPSLQETLQAKNNDLLSNLSLSTEDRFFVDNADLEVALAIYKAMSTWPKIEPKMVISPMFLYAGTNDEPVYTILTRQSSSILKAGIKLQFVENLDHFQTIMQKEKIMPEVINFMSTCCE